MARFTKKYKKEIGLAPDELFFRGEKRVNHIVLKLIDFDAIHQEEISVENIATVLPFIDKTSVTWLSVEGLHNKAMMQDIATSFSLDNLILADVMDVQARPKVHEYSNCIALSLKMLQLDGVSGTIKVENLSLILTPSVVITFQETNSVIFDPVRERIRNQKKRIRHSGADYLLFALLDIVVDNYIYIISILGDKIEELEEQLLADDNRSFMEDINTHKRELNFLRKNINPAKEMILSLSKIDSELISESNTVHFKELLDNIKQAIETTDSYREILSDQLNMYHTAISSKLNDVMKLLTVFSVIFIPLTFIAGIYGTNFEVIPELKYQYSYFIMLGVMVVLAIVMLIYFRKRKWL